MAQAQSPTVRLTIDDIAFGGKGVARHEGKVVFVPFTIPGEEVAVRIVKQKKNFAEAELLAVEKSSPNRVEPRCPYFQRCGGCSYQHIDYARQLEIKSRQVAQTLQRVGKLRDVPMHPIIASPQAYGYRNRIRVHAEEGVVGFYAQDRHELIDIQSCAIASEQVNEALRDLRARSLRDGDYTLAESGGGRVFSQINNEVAQEMLNLVGRLVRRGQLLLIDAYCGAGMFAKFLAPHFQKVIGIEENEFAVGRARRDADAKETYLAGDVAAHLDSILSQHDPRRTTLILDPPAIGISARVCDSILAASPIEIFYVSCNPATLARDLAILCRTCQVESVTPLDMFPQTAEIEAVAHLVGG
jgi:23S rRNA (uracil1939-C5)-methyltransferase